MSWLKLNPNKTRCWKVTIAQRCAGRFIVQRCTLAGCALNAVRTVQSTGGSVMLNRFRRVFHGETIPSRGFTIMLMTSIYESNIKLGMDLYVEQKSVLKTLDESIKGWDKNFGISRMEYLRIRFRNLPAADVAPVVHGKWIVVQTFEDCVYAKCSNCDVTQIFYHNKPLTKFCPDCGAKMDL